MFIDKGVHNWLNNVVASSSFPLTPRLVIVTIVSELGTTGLDSIENPIAVVIGSVPNIAVDWFVRNWNNSQVGSVSILLSMGGTFIITSGSSVTAVRENIELRII